MSNPINIVLCIDQSGSMGAPFNGNTSLGVAQTDASYFAAVQASANMLGMVAFSTTATIKCALLPMTLTNKLVLADNIFALKAGGMTDIQGAIDSANGMLTNTTASNSIVLLTDGNANVGTVPPVAPTGCAPIYPIGLGPSVNTSNLQTLAKSTGGTYYAAPTVAQLSQMYNDIVTATGVAATLTNQQGTVGPVDFVQGATMVGEGASMVRIGATWTNPTLSYTTGTPGANQISLFIQCPPGTSQPATPTMVGDGYVAYEIQNPTAGTYTSYAYGGGEITSDATIGAFDPSLQAKLTFTAPRTARLGQIVEVPCQVADANESAVQKWTLSGFVDSPSVDPKEIAITHKADLAALNLPQAGEPVTDNQRMLALADARGSDRSLFTRQKSPLTIAHGQGTNQFSFTPHVRGVHIANIKGEGFDYAAGRSFSLVRVVPILVE